MRPGSQAGAFAGTSPGDFLRLWRQIVKAPLLLSWAFPLLHIHSGWLPDYRGSTTSYYSLLERGTLRRQRHHSRHAD